MPSSQLQQIVQQASKLPAAEQLELIRRVAEHLAQRSQAEMPFVREPQYLEYGKYRNSGFGRPSTEEDFKLAEWRLTGGNISMY